MNEKRAEILVNKVNIEKWNKLLSDKTFTGDRNLFKALIEKAEHRIEELENPVYIYEVKVEFFAGMEMNGIMKAKSIPELLEDEDIAGKLPVADLVVIKRIGVHG